MTQQVTKRRRNNALWMGAGLLAAGLATAVDLTAPVRAASAEPTGPLAEAYNTSGQDLLRRFADKPGNIVFSPYSIGTAMAMVLSGARGETQAEMLTALRHLTPAADVDAANARALAALAAYNTPAGGKDKPVAQLKIANALMLVNAAATVAPAFQDTIRTQYASEIFRGASLDTVNGWAKNKTGGKIDRILEKLDPNASHVLLNAVYFNAPWQHAFAKSATESLPFTLPSGETTSVPTMAQQRAFAIAKGEGYAAIRLPYAAEGLSMVIVRPDKYDGLDAFIVGLDGAKTKALLQSVKDAAPRMVSLTMPRFKISYTADLVEPFKSLGMTKVFDHGQSDLSGLTGLPRSEAQSAISQIVHRAVIDVAEEGTEAAAVTAVVVTTRAMRQGEVERFAIDRPFVFMITDDRTGAILFEGRVIDPGL